MPPREANAEAACASHKDPLCEIRHSNVWGWVVSGCARYSAPCWAPWSRIHESTAPQHPLRFPDASEPSARFGAQVRTHALMPQLARHHELTAVMLVHEEFDIEECRRAMQVYCREVDWSTTAPVGKVLPNGCCNSGPWPPPGASTGCGSQCQRCTGRWTRSSALGGLTSSTWNFRTLATASCARLRPAQYVAARGARREEVGFGDCHCEVELTRIHRRCARRDGGRHGSSW